MTSPGPDDPPCLARFLTAPGERLSRSVSCTLATLSYAASRPPASVSFEAVPNSALRAVSYSSLASLSCAASCALKAGQCVPRGIPRTASCGQRLAPRSSHVESLSPLAPTGDSLTESCSQTPERHQVWCASHYNGLHTTRSFSNGPGQCLVRGISPAPARRPAHGIFCASGDDLRVVSYVPQGRMLLGHLRIRPVRSISGDPRWCLAPASCTLLGAILFP